MWYCFKRYKTVLKNSSKRSINNKIEKWNFKLTSKYYARKYFVSWWKVLQKLTLQKHLCKVKCQYVTTTQMCAHTNQENIFSFLILMTHKIFYGTTIHAQIEIVVTKESHVVCNTAIFYCSESAGHNQLTKF